ncbi:MAG: VCP-like ATPase [Candidatus Heimdallarchaeota archaeon LC_3]|uniref:Putative AAA-type ATPase Vps4 n=1 Tax=uncultured organism TaxID=155900 RepID=A0A0F6PX33_9ZZZZ|nr:putative AAA-type ATPase Vps4 [uncultured organism]OLS27542.1 MAG: VCP-like ATPase [Candidatus Heimdallarchaeota archaeon LC_3]
MSSGRIDLLNQAREDAKTAVELDKAGRGKEAINYYVRAAENLQHVFRFTHDEKMKQTYYDRILGYLNRAEELKAHPEGKSSTKTGKNGKDDSDSELSSAIEGTIIREKPNVKWDDVANLVEAKLALREAIILPMARPDLFTGARKPWKGILMFGPPGCGKTYLAKAVASEVDATFFSISAANIVSKWLGEAEKLVKQLYDSARKEAPSIIFFDEVDSLVSSRGGGENEAMRRVKTQLMQAIEGIGTGDELIVTIGATNLPWELDPAMRRRFEKRIMITLPDEEARSIMFKIHTRGVELDAIDFDMLGKLSVGFSAADIALICREALLFPIREMDVSGLLQNKDLNPRNPQMVDFENALVRIKPTVAPEELANYNEWAEDFGNV